MAVTGKAVMTALRRDLYSCVQGGKGDDIDNDDEDIIDDDDDDDDDNIDDDDDDDDGRTDKASYRVAFRD